MEWVCGPGMHKGSLLQAAVQSDPLGHARIETW